MSSFQAELPLSNPNTPPTDWGRIFESHRRWLSTIVRARLADPHAAADVLQEVALAVVSQPNTPDSPEKIAPWLYRITLRKIVNHHRSNGRRKRLIENFLEKSNSPQRKEAAAEPGEWLLQREIQASVHEGLSKLPPQDRQLLLLKYTEDWGYEQLAEHLGVSIKTIEYRLLKARRALRAEITKST